MGFFGANSSPIEADIEKATNEKNTQEKWDLIMNICDKVATNGVSPKECLKLIIRRLNHNDPHVVMQAITLLDACVKNCGKSFHLEIASREFETEFKKLLTKSQQKVQNELKLCLKKWAEGDFKTDPKLSLIPSLLNRLKSEGYDFVDTNATPKREITLPKDPNIVSSQQEEDDIAKAIELSLKENSKSPKKSSGGATASSDLIASSSSSLYPSALLSSATASNISSAPPAELRKVRALYDFEAAEDNELTFKAGEIIFILDDSDANWWKGQNHRGEGLFPSNFVSPDLNAEIESVTGGGGSKTKKSVQFDEASVSGVTKTEKKDENILEINEEKIDRLLHLLHEVDPEDPSQDSDEMLNLESVVNQMGPLIDAELERVDRKHAQLTQLSSDLVEAINLYHTLMREPPVTAGGLAGAMGGAPYGYQMPHMPGPMYSLPPHASFSQQVPPHPGAMFQMPMHQNHQPNSLPPYGVPHLRNDLSQMNLNGFPQHPPQQQQQPPVTSQPNSQPIPMQNGQQQTHPNMPNMTVQSMVPPAPPTHTLANSNLLNNMQQVAMFNNNPTSIAPSMFPQPQQQQQTSDQHNQQQPSTHLNNQLPTNHHHHNIPPMVFNNPQGNMLPPQTTFTTNSLGMMQHNPMSLNHQPNTPQNIPIYQQQR
uniref:Putative signal transducing adaptor protein stam/stam2 n=1 Tax=Corethrella appendiculata TaxID=1370023 RepID=U5EWZ4_9DIPT